MSLQVNGDDIESGTHRPISERSRLVPPKPPEQHARPKPPPGKGDIFLATAHAITFGLVALYFILVFSDSYNSPNNASICQFGGQQFSSPLNYAVVALASLSAAFTVISFLVLVCSNESRYSILFLPACVFFLVIAIEQGLLLTTNMKLQTSCIIVIVFGAVSAAIHAICLLFAIHSSYLERASHPLNIPPADSWCTMVYTEFGHPAPPGQPRFLHCRGWQTKVAIGTSKHTFSKYEQFSLTGLPAPDYPILTDLDGNRTDFADLVLRRRSTIMPLHCQVLRDISTHNIYVRLHPDTSDHQTLLGLCDATRFTDKQEYIGADFSSAVDSNFTLPGSPMDLHDTLLRPMPRALETFGPLVCIFNMDAFKRRLNELVELGIDPRGELFPRTRVVIAFSDAFSNDLRATARGEVGVEIILHEARALLDQAPHSLHLATRRRPGQSVAASASASAVSSTAVSTVATPTKGLGSGTVTDLEQQLAQAHNKIKLLKRRNREQQTQAQEQIERLEQMLMQTTQAATSLKEKASARIAALRQQLEAQQGENGISQSLPESGLNTPRRDRDARPPVTPRASKAATENGAAGE